MRGSVLNWLGGTVADFLPLNTTQPAHDIVFPSVQEFHFWKWRVKKLRLSGSITIDGTPYAIDEIIVKGATSDIGPNVPISTESEMVCGFGGWSYQHAYAMHGIVFGWFFYGRHNEASEFEQDWWAGFSVNFAGPIDLSTTDFVLPGDLTSAEVVINQADPVLGVTYNHTVPFYKPAGATETVTGTLDLEVYDGGGGWFEWKDENYIPKYDADTGVRLVS